MAFDINKVVVNIKGELYSKRPAMAGVGKCIICGKRPSMGTDPRSFGFRKAAHARHQYSCFEKALRLLGYVETIYDEKTKLFRVAEL